MRKYVIVLLTLCMTFSTSLISFAESINVKTYKYDNDIQMNGITSSTSKFFFVQSNWQVREGKLNLVFTKSELLQLKDSTITIYINDTPISSIRLDEEKQYKKSIQVSIPADLVTDGYNELKIRAYKTISDELCQDDANTANWLVIHNESAISIAYNYKEMKNELASYPDLFLNNEGSLSLNTSIVIPDEVTSGEMKASMMLSANMGQRKKFDTFQIEVERYSDFSNDKLNMIYIGKEENSPKEILNLLTEQEKTHVKQGGLLKMVNRGEKGKQLLILSNQDDLLENGVKMISSDLFIRTLNQDTFFFDQNVKVEDSKNEEDNRIYLKDLGYENILLRGPYTQAADLDINPSKSFTVSKGSNLHLNVRYANNLDFERSLATVFVNNVPIGSKKLSKNKSNGDTLSFVLPKDVLGATYYQVRVVFHLELLDRGCVSRDTENPWAFVASDSYMDYEYEEKDHVTFKQYPAPFIEQGRFNEVTLVTPNQIDSETLTDLGNLFVQMGREMTSQNGILRILSAKEADKKDLKGNMILMGTPENNPIIKEINKQLYISYSKDYRYFESNEKVPLTKEYGAEVVTMQFIDSPFDKGYSTLVITSAKDEKLHLSRKFLADTSLLRSLQGDAVILDQNGTVTDLNFVEEKPKEEQKILGEKMLSGDGKFFFAIAAYVAITLIITVVLLIRKYRK